MSALEISAVTSRTATLLLCPKTALFRLSKTVNWQLFTGSGTSVAEGITSCVPVFVEDLSPNAQYRFTCDLGDIEFTTLSCNGLVDVSDFGAHPDQADNSAAFQRALKSVPMDGTLYVPPGRYVSGPIFLQSHMNFYVANGAEIAGLSSRENWPILPSHDGQGRVSSTWEGQPEACFASVISASDCTGLTMTGKGIIDGGGDRGDWWTWPKETRQGARRPRTVFLAHCRDTVLSGLTIRNSPSWTVHPFCCNGLTATALKIENPPDSPNTDGFNPESCLDLELSGLFISVGDDCIAVKAGKRGIDQVDHLAPTRHLNISNCLMQRGHGAVVLGSEMSGDITDVTITRCEFDGTDRGLRIKTRRGRGGTVARITLDQVEMVGVATPLAVNAFYFCDSDGKHDWVQSRAPAAKDETTPDITQITLRDVTARGVQHAAAALLGLPEAPLSAIKIERFRVSFDPEAIPAPPLMACNVPAVRHAGILAEFAEIDGDLAPFLPHEDHDTC